MSGALARGSTLAIAVDATMPGGWEDLHLVDVVVRSGDEVLDRIRFDIEDYKMKVGEQDLVVGTGAVARGKSMVISTPLRVPLLASIVPP